MRIVRASDGDKGVFQYTIEVDGENGARVTVTAIDRGRVYIDLHSGKLDITTRPGACISLTPLSANPEPEP